MEQKVTVKFDLFVNISENTLKSIFRIINKKDINIKEFFYEAINEKIINEKDKKYTNSKKNFFNVTETSI